ncbi:ankyrin repeat domain-containing protein [Demetria terragena]|uniref:ankyrin repeat domain-containing protein n=1 Tax=Demetria terragena TaxID=63959 RepID=UPI00036A5A0B|nr:ankyrin repeat domain-containing protein [Demetria terragena]
MFELTQEQAGRVLEIAMDLARQGETEQLLEFCDHGLPVDSQDADGNSLLMLSAYHGHVGTVSALLDRGANPDLRNSRDQTPVAGALFKGEDAVVAALVAAGADLDAGTPTARQAAALFGRAGIALTG